MTDKERESLLWIVTGVAVGLLALNYLVIDPAVGAWTAQSGRIDALQKKVARGQSLVERETRIRNQWAAMLRANLPLDDSTAENDTLKAMNRWTIDSGVIVTSYAPQHQAREDSGYDAFEYRVIATGDQAKVGQFLYDLGTDAMPCSLEECEIATRDAHGAQLTLSARFSFVRVDVDSGNAGNGRERGNAN